MARILIVEDEALIAELLFSYLDELGHAAIGPATSVCQALALVARDLPDFSFLDLVLGREKSFPIAEDLQRRNLPFAFATGFGAAEIPEQFKGSPVVAKPYAFEEIQRVLGAYK
jgi:DNA-binding response OmpR family regulator